MFYIPNFTQTSALSTLVVLYSLCVIIAPVGTPPMGFGTTVHGLLCHTVPETFLPPTVLIHVHLALGLQQGTEPRNLDLFVTLSLDSIAGPSPHVIAGMVSCCHL